MVNLLSYKEILDLEYGTFVRKTSWGKGLCARRTETSDTGFRYYKYGVSLNFVPFSVITKGYYEITDKYGKPKQIQQRKKQWQM